MSKFEKYLALWVILCMAVGVLLSQTVPGIGEAIESWQVRGISIPIGICLFLMMYPALLNLQLSELKKLRDNPKPIILTLVSNWLIAPLVAAGLAIGLVLQFRGRRIVGPMYMEPSVVLGVATFVVFGALLWAIHSRRLRGAKAAALVLVGFVLVVLSLLGGGHAPPLG